MLGLSAPYPCRKAACPMCRFHREPAGQAAAAGGCGQVDRVREAVFLAAIAQFRIEDIMPALGPVSGYDLAQLTTPAARQALATSRPMSDPARIATEAAAVMPVLRARLDQAVAGLDEAALGLPAGPHQRDLWHRKAQRALWVRDATGNRQLADTAAAPGYQPLLEATRRFLAAPGTAQMLQTVFDAAVLRSFSEAAAGRPAAPDHVCTCRMNGPR